MASELQTVDTRRLTFTVRVQAPSGFISQGTHSPALMNAHRFC